MNSRFLKSNFTPWTANESLKLIAFLVSAFSLTFTPYSNAQIPSISSNNAAALSAMGGMGDMRPHPGE
jgi:hypothetical protein